jgi:KUP system potassium uptake protein
MQEEISMIEKNCTWELVERPPEKNIIGVKWVFRTKLNADRTIKKHKAMLRFMVLIILIHLLL